jgi:tryptophan-rich sensory protein
MKKHIIVFLAFLSLNFLALGLGGLFTADGVSSEWYQTLNKAPWTPPGWVFGAAWTFLMCCFTVFMTMRWSKDHDRKKTLILYSIQWILNVSWNPIFFYFHQNLLGLIDITLLLSVVIILGITTLRTLRFHTLWILPYVLWLMIATSLNAYIVFFN